jgi:hypothetical protein
VGTKFLSINPVVRCTTGDEKSTAVKETTLGAFVVLEVRKSFNLCDLLRVCFPKRFVLSQLGGLVSIVILLGPLPVHCPLGVQVVVVMLQCLAALFRWDA